MVQNIQSPDLVFGLTIQNFLIIFLYALQKATVVVWSYHIVLLKLYFNFIAVFFLYFYLSRHEFINLYSGDY